MGVGVAGAPRIVNGGMWRVKQLLCVATRVYCVGGPYLSPNQRAAIPGGILAVRCSNAANRIANGQLDSAVALMTSVLEKIDGQAPPKDWMSDSPEKTTVANHVNALLVLLSL